MFQGQDGSLSSGLLLLKQMSLHNNYFHSDETQTAVWLVTYVLEQILSHNREKCQAPFEM